MLFFLICSFLFILVGQVYSQSARISHFSVSEFEGNSSLIEWTMNAGSTCIDLSVQRSLDNVNFNTVYIYPGVCGSNSTKVNYYWVDSNPIQFAKNYYRIKLEEAEFTLSEWVDFKDKNTIRVFPNPVLSSLNLQFSNLKNELFDLNIYNSLGMVVLKKTNLQKETIHLEVSELSSGYFYIHIRFFSGKIIRTKFFKI